MDDKFEKHGCNFKNESECEEELDDACLDMHDEENRHYDDDEYEEW